MAPQRTYKKKLTSTSCWTRFKDTHASISPLSTHGNVFSGPISMFSKATVVNVVAAFNGLPNSTLTPNVSKLISTGVVAQKYTHIASRYFRLAR